MDFEGEWTLDKNENYESFLKAAGMGGIKRTMAVKLGGSVLIKAPEKSKVYIKNVNGPKTKEKEITLNEEYNDEGADGTPATGTTTIEGKALVTKMKTKAGKNVVIRREVNSQGLLEQTMDFEGTVCKRYFKKK